MFSIIKASDITAWFLGRSGRVMTKATLSSLFYLSERRSLLERNLPLTGGTLVSLPEGTAVLEIKEILESAKPPLAWLTRIGTLPDGRLKLDLRRQPPSLPVSETRILEEAISELGSLPLPFFGYPRRSALTTRSGRNPWGRILCRLRLKRSSPRTGNLLTGPISPAAEL